MSDLTKEICKQQFKILAQVDSILEKNGLRMDEAFKKRVFENIEFIERLKYLEDVPKRGVDNDIEPPHPPLSTLKTRPIHEGFSNPFNWLFKNKK